MRRRPSAAPRRNSISSTTTSGTCARAAARMTVGLALVTSAMQCPRSVNNEPRSSPEAGWSAAIKMRAAGRGAGKDHGHGSRGHGSRGHGSLGPDFDPICAHNLTRTPTATQGAAASPISLSIMSHTRWQRFLAKWHPIRRRGRSAADARRKVVDPAAGDAARDAGAVDGGDRDRLRLTIDHVRAGELHGAETREAG